MTTQELMDLYEHCFLVARTIKYESHDCEQDVKNNIECSICNELLLAEVIVSGLRKESTII